MGYGYKWEVILLGGPGDGCKDIVINLKEDKPPKIIRKIIDGEIIRRESLGEKIIDYLAKDIDENQKIAIYALENKFNGKKYKYQYLETIRIDEFKLKYDNY